MARKCCKEVLTFAASVMSFALLADAGAAKAAKRFATGGEVTSFHYVTNGVGYTAFLHTFTDTATAAVFRNTSGKTFPVRLLAVGGGGAGMDGYRGTPSTFVCGGGGGGGGGVTETNAVLSAGDVWTIRVGAGGGIPSHSYKVPRYEAGASSVSNGVSELVLTPGGGAGGSRPSNSGIRPTVGAAGGGGSGKSTTERSGTNGVYTSSTFISEGAANPSGGNGGETAYGGGGGGAGADGYRATGGSGLASDITGEEVVYGSGGGGGGLCRGSSIYAGGDGGLNAGVGGTGDATSIVKATDPVANTGSGGAGGVSFGGDEDSAFDATYSHGTPGADGVVIRRYDISDTPCIGGDIVTVTTNGNMATYIHTFTNTTSAATFEPSIAFDGTSVRMLVVGGGGAGMDGNKGTPGKAVYGGGGGGGGGVTETNALLSVGDVWTIRVGAGGGIPASHSYQAARYEAGASSVSNGVSELVLTPGGGAGGSRPSSINGVRPTVGAAGGGGSGDSAAAERAGASGTYTSSTLFPGEIGIVNPSGGNGGSKTYGGGGGGAGASGDLKVGGRGLTSDITGEEIVYGSGGGGGGFCRDDFPNKRTGGDGGPNAGFGGTYVVDGSVTNICCATTPVANTGSGGAGGISFGGTGEAYSTFDATYAYGTPGADGVVIIRYEVEIPRPNGFMIIFR